MKINLYEVLLCISNAVDLVTPELSNHHQQVAYLSYRIAEEMHVSKEEQRDILIAGMLHDIGALTLEERLTFIEQEPVSVNGHAFRSAKLLEELCLLQGIARTVRYHHIAWDYGNGRYYNGTEVPLSSHILHLADRTCLLLKKTDNVLVQIPEILETIRSENDQYFWPEAETALEKLAVKEHIWLSLAYKSPLECLPTRSIFGMSELAMDELIQLSKIFSRIIDFRSRFTSTHSAGVACTAKQLGKMTGFSKKECDMLLIAGYLHDLGKLAIPNSLLEKPGTLTKEEFDLIRCHTFYTYQLLNTIEGFQTVNQWASYHHEKLDGSGYPFHLTGEDIPLGSRILAVADVFTAITEDRPYRKGMDKSQVVEVMQSTAKAGSLAPEIVSLLLRELDSFTEGCKEVQMQAEKEYEDFFRI